MQCLRGLTPGGDQPGALTRDMAALVAVAAFASLVVLGLWMRGQIDEFNRSLSTESSALALRVSLLLFGGWAALAHLGYVEWIAPLGLPPCVPPSLVTGICGTGIFTRCPSPTRCRLGLGPTHPQLISMAAEPWGIRWGGFLPPLRYSYRHSHSSPLQPCSRSTFSADDDAPLPEDASASSPRLRCWP